MIKIICPRCGNEDPTLFGKRNGEIYCRACINFRGKQAHIPRHIKPKDVEPRIDYELSKKQQKLASKITEAKKDIYVNAVCGSGKTEMVFQSINKAIKQGYRVGFIIPRKEVVKEISERLKSVYPALNIAAVYGGHNKDLDGDIIVLTAHQAYRYPQKFGLLIVDEYDAFPLKGNQTLLRLIQKTCYGKKIYLSATFSDQELIGKEKLELNRRYHSFDLPIPKVYIGNRISGFYRLLIFIKKNKEKPIFIYVPTIKKGFKLCLLLRLFLLQPLFFHSQSDDKERKFADIKNQKEKLVVTTTILERGITLVNLQIVVYEAANELFDYRTLIQIAGRVGRKKEAPLGQVLFLATHTTIDIERAIKEIVDKNNRFLYA